MLSLDNVSASHRTIEGVGQDGMRPRFLSALVLAGCLIGSIRLCAQAGDAANPAPAASQSAPAANQAKPANPAGGNPFPEDTSDVPVMPSKGTPDLPPGTYTGADDQSGSPRVPLAAGDADPAHSPDDATSAEGSPSADESSSSFAGMDKLLPSSDDDRKNKNKVPEHQETAKEDISVGGYYLEKKNWKAAQSRFQSAMVLDPEDPEVYWGLAEADRHLGDFADARGYYLKLLDYDPDGPHGKAARKALNEPEIANGKNAEQVKLPTETAK
jgi:tetratricopeptide (TPR) repeat protein